MTICVTANLTAVMNAASNLCPRRCQAGKSVRACATDGANRRLELFADWSQIDLVRPGAALLLVKLEISFRDRNRGQNIVGLSITFLTNHAVDDHVGDVKASWTEFASHTLRQGAKTELWDGKGRKAKTATN